MASDQTGLRSNDPTTIINKSKSPTEGLLMFPANLGVHCTLMRFFKYSYGGVRGSEVKSVSDIVLPLPKQIQDSFKINVAGDEIGARQSALAQGIVGPEEMLKSMTSISMPTSTSGLKDVATDATMLGLAKAMPNAANAIKAGKGTAINPFATLMFKGVDLKVHSLEWMLSPDSEQESRTLKNIIQKLQSMVLPTVGGIASNTDLTAIDRGLLQYPHMVDIYFQGIDSNYYFKFKTSMISQISVDYTPNGIAINKGGRPSAIRLTMTLQEAFIHTADDYENGETAVEFTPESVGGVGFYDNPSTFGSGISTTGEETSNDDTDSSNFGTILGGAGLIIGDSGTGVASSSDIVTVDGVALTRGDLYLRGVTDADISDNPLKYSVTSNPSSSVNIGIPSGGVGGTGGGSPWPKFSAGSTSNTATGQSRSISPSNGLKEDEVFIVNAAGNGGRVETRANLRLANITDEQIANNPTLYIVGTDSVLPGA